MNEQFANDILEGLTANPKWLPSKYFYDEAGDKLFQEIMGLSEYYLTNAEYQVLQKYKDKLLAHADGEKQVNLIELGAGDGMKTKVLLSYFLKNHRGFTYIPIDISANALDLLESDLSKTYPNLHIKGIQGDYPGVLQTIKKEFNTRKLVLFLGSNLGNFSREAAKQFLEKLSASLSKGDLLLIGIDLQKDPMTILKAYNDKLGVTAKFNYNILHRLNRELGADFRIQNFYHYPVYEPRLGEARSYLVSKFHQEVTLQKINKTVTFVAGEAVLTEISRKYTLDQVHDLARLTGFDLIDNYLDDNAFFTDSLWKVK